MGRRSREQLDAPGQDSFLDIVANLVGILIILIMVIGARATDAMVESAEDDQTSPSAPQVDLQSARAAAQDVGRAIHEVDAKIKRQDLEIAYRRTERDKMLQILGTVEQQLAAREESLSADEQQRLAASRELLAARSEVQELEASLEALTRSAPQDQVIQHLPTPMAQTVFGREVHFRLQGGRICYVPWDELVDRLKEDAPSKVWKLKEVPRITEVLGPVRGFRMKYTLRHAQQMRPVSGGVAVQRRIELDRFVLVPVQEDLGEPLAAALSETSEFHAILSEHEPSRTTITVWVYADSFSQFRELKADLFRRGYAAAGRPMPDGHPIGGAPDGSRSAAQ